MVAYTLDIAGVRFWVAAAVAILVLNLCPSGELRRVAWAGVNVGFLAVLLRLEVLYVIGGLILVFLALRATGPGAGEQLPLKLVAAGGSGLFLLNKLPMDANQIRSFVDGLPGSPLLLTAVGVALSLYLIQGAIRRRFRSDVLAGLAMLGLGVLAVRYLPSGRQQVALDQMERVLGTIGFSYVALRLVEVFGAVYEGRQAAPGLLALVNYLIPFHMLGAGPIQAYDEFAAQPAIVEPPAPLDVLRAFERIAFGIFKKYVVATSIHTVFLTDFQTLGVYTLLEAQLFFLWLYLDFSAYSDIAVGLGRLMGVATPENFNRPYFARNIVDFWERWHISLSQFIRRNIYIPLFASILRQERPPDPLAGSAVALAVSFILCGLWHGLSPQFVVWGAVHAFGLVVVQTYQQLLRRRLGSAGLKAYRSNPTIRAVSTIVTYEFVAFSLLVIFLPF